MTRTWRWMVVLAAVIPLAWRPGEAVAAGPVDELGARLDLPGGLDIAALRTATVSPEGLAEAASRVAGTVGASRGEGWVVFEDWRTPTLRSDRWVGVTGNGLDARREIAGNHLATRFRLEAPTTSGDAGFTGSMQRLHSKTAALTTRIAADFQIMSYEAVGCASNAMGTRVRPAIVDVTGFNDGSSWRPGDATGDHFLRVIVNREATSVDPWNELTVQAFLFRCVDAACSNAISWTYDLDMARVFVGMPFTLRAEWQPAEHRFVAGVDGFPDVVLPYPAGADVSPARAPFASVRSQSVNANCSTHATVTDSTVNVFEVRTNPEAAVP
jgi:hypothetical protein